MSTFNKPTRPQNCGTGYCSCIECVMEKPKSAFDTSGPSIWSRDAIAKRQIAALKAANTELQNRGLRARDEFTTFCKAKAK